MQKTSFPKLTTEMAEDSEKTPWSKRQRRSSKEKPPKRKQYIVSENRQYINNSLYWARKYARIFVLDITRPEKRTVFLELRSWKTVRFEEQIMFKYPSMFSSQMEGIVFIIVEIVFVERTVSKIGYYSRILPTFSLGT